MIVRVLRARINQLRDALAVAAHKPPLSDVRSAVGLSHLLHAWRGDRLEMARRFDRAACEFRRALSVVDRRFYRKKVYVVRPQMHFRMHRAAHLNGAAEEYDPLFACRIEPAGSGRSESGVGSFEVLAYASGLRIVGRLFDARSNRLELRLDGKTLLTAKLSAGGSRWFRMELRRPVVRLLPQRGRLSACTEQGRALLCGGASELDLSIPHGDGSIFDRIAAGAKLTKKGYLTPTDDELRRRHARYLELYGEVREVLQRRVDRELFLMYGTLLGFYRDGDFIPGDDDFDVGYLSAERSPEAVRAESARIMGELAREGFLVSVNAQGRPFRVRGSDDGAEIHLDVRPLWHESGRVWAHLQASLPTGIETFAPAFERSFRGTSVLIPANSERFLELYYGKGWRVPDPNYTNTNRGLARVKRHLSRACLTPAEIVELQRKVAAGDPGAAGRIASPATVDLYPLERFERLCGW